MTRNRSSALQIGVFVLLAALMAGCATVPPPTSQMSQASSALDRARAAGAADYAPLELGFAVKKMDLAQAAMASEDYALAAELAEESEANSNLARVKSELASLREKIDQQGDDNARARSQLDDPGTVPGGVGAGGPA